MWLRGLRYDSFHYLAPTIPESVFCTFELMFAIFTAAIVFGPFANKVKFFPMILFFMLWHLTVYCPTAHSVWHPMGFLSKAGVQDYAGGSVVHICAGMSGLAVLLVLKSLKRAPSTESTSANNILTYIGLALLWVGWFGLDCGKAYGANYRSGYAMLITQIAVGTSAISWTLVDIAIRKGAPSKLSDLYGMINGAFAGEMTLLSQFDKLAKEFNYVYQCYCPCRSYYNSSSMRFCRPHWCFHYRIIGWSCLQTRS